MKTCFTTEKKSSGTKRGENKLKERKLLVQWIGYLWVFDYQAHRRHLSVSQDTLCRLLGALLISQVSDTAYFKAVRGDVVATERQFSWNLI